jgi:hypothetical protein
VKLQVRYNTDPFVAGRGFEFDDVVVKQGATTVWVGRRLRVARPGR